MWDLFKLMKYNIVSCTSCHHDITRKEMGHLTNGQLSVIPNISEIPKTVTMNNQSMVGQTTWNNLVHAKSKVHRPYMAILHYKPMLWQQVKNLTAWSLHPYYLWQGSTNLRCQICHRAAHCQLIDNLDTRGFVSCSLYLTTCLCRSSGHLFWKQTLLCFWNLPPKFNEDNFCEYNNTLHF
jgi:hypothetical protein